MFGVYEILETVGQGGMGVVYRAHDTALDRIVALKVLKEDLRANKQVAARFQREAQAIASLSHPGIIHIYAVGAVGRIPFISMEFIEGTTLSQLMKRERRIEWKRALHIAEQVSEALACAHDAHIIHRDIKPGNVLLGPDDRAYVTDFGIAKVLTAETQLTVEGSRLGTPNYMSPERCTNKEITPSSDIYSLGVVLFQMISGRLPYEASSPVELIRKIVSEPPARLTEHVPEVPEDVERLVAHLIEKKPSDRPRSAEQVAQMCRRVIEGEPLFEESAVASSLRAARDSEPSTSTGTTGLSDTSRITGPIATVRHWWSDAPATLRLWIAGAVAIAAAGGLGQLAAMQSSEGFARQTVSQWDRSTEGWMRTASPAEFTPESQGVTLVRVNLPRLASTRLFPVSMSDFVVEFDGPGGEGGRVRAVGLLASETLAMELVIPPRSVPGEFNTIRLIGAEPGASPAFSDSTAVFVSDGRVGLDGAWTPYVRRVDASLVNEDYGGPLLSAEDLPAGGAVRTLESVAVAPSEREVAVVTGDGSSAGFRVHLAPIASGALSGTPRELGTAGPPVLAVRFAPGATILVARTSPGGGLNIRRFGPAEGDESVRYATQEGTAQLADMTPSAAVVVSGAAGTRKCVHVDLRTGATVALGAATAAALHSDGNTVLVIASDYRGNPQVYAVDVKAPDERRQLTFLTQGVGDIVAISRDGRFAAATVNLPDAPGLALIALDATATAAQ